jgi:hypothetical protein
MIQCIVFLSETQTSHEGEHNSRLMVSLEL